MYSSIQAAVKPRPDGPIRRAGPAATFGPRIYCTAVACALVTFGNSAWTQSRGSFMPSLSCDATLTALFTPPRPRLGRYEVCTTPEPLAAVTPEGWFVERVPPIDAFGTAGRYDRSRVARLYGGRPATVARGWVKKDGTFEAITLVSPHPDATLTHLVEGTMVIRFIISYT
jgi:hypothetical protein